MQTREMHDATCSPAIVGVFPRRKAGENSVSGRRRLPIRVDLDCDCIRMLFGMRQSEAAKTLTISLTALKQVCRKLGIVRWPYHRPYKRGSRYRTKQDAMAIDEVNAPKLRTDDADTRACLAVSADSGTARSLHDVSHPELAIKGMFPYLYAEDCKLSTSSYAASMATDHHTALLYFLPEEISSMSLDADDHDLGWLVTSGNSYSHPVVEDLAFNMVWRERYALEAKKAGMERSARFFNLAWASAPCLFPSVGCSELGLVPTSV